MPTLAEASNPDLSGYSPATPGTADVPQRYTPPASQTNDMQPGYNPAIRCPLPPIYQATPDSLRQFYSSSVPQTRLLSAVISGISGGGGSGGNVVTSSVITTGGGVVPPPIQLSAQQVVLTSTVLGPGAQFTGTITLKSESFQLLSVSTSTNARIEIYGTAFAQTADLSRPLDQPAPAGSTQNIITDVVLDTLPFAWTFQNRVGANGDSPQTSQVYVTLTNLSGAAVPVTATILYVPLESA